MTLLVAAVAAPPSAMAFTTAQGRARADRYMHRSVLPDLKPQRWYRYGCKRPEVGLVRCTYVLYDKWVNEAEPFDCLYRVGVRKRHGHLVAYTASIQLGW